MQFQVPQFETESKLVGPFTLIQFVYVGAAIVISFLLFTVLTTWFWLIVSAILVGSSLIIALVKVNGRPMPIFISAAFSYLWEPKTLALKLKVIGERVRETISPEVPIATIPSAGSFPAMPPVSPEAPTEIPPVMIPVEPVSPPIMEPPSPAVFVSPLVEPAPPPIGELAPEKKKSRLQNLFNKMTTTSLPIPFREETLQQTSARLPKGYELIEKPTGETIAARRVDYR
ncbi:MAG: hypothetical protein WC565_02430 [Parcubacteria group bacterium]